VNAEIVPDGPFSLRAAAELGFGPDDGKRPAFDGAMRLAFAIDGGRGYAGALLRQHETDGPVAVELQLSEDGDSRRALRQLERILSLDHDGEQFLEVGERDPVIGELQEEHQGQRPVLFHSPYEAAAWAIISARRTAAQGARTREAIAERLGENFRLADRRVHCFPQPERLLELSDPTPGLTPEKVARLRALAEAALDGALEVERLHALGPDATYVELQRLNGLGPFYAGLVVLRACGFADAMLQAPEPKLLGHVARFYRLPEPPSLEQLTAIAEPWRPFRTWAMVLIRLAGDRGERRGAR
jgi:DNA-3-methyladenine glycosylase II